MFASLNQHQKFRSVSIICGLENSGKGGGDAHSHSASGSKFDQKLRFAVRLVSEKRVRMTCEMMLNIRADLSAEHAWTGVHIFPYAMQRLLEMGAYASTKFRPISEARPDGLKQRLNDICDKTPLRICYARFWPITHCRHRPSKHFLQITKVKGICEQRIWNIANTFHQEILEE